MLVSVDGLGQQEMQVVQRHGGDERQHAVLVRDLHGDVDSGAKMGRDSVGVHAGNHYVLRGFLTSCSACTKESTIFCPEASQGG